MLEHDAPTSDPAHLADSLPLYFQLLLYEHRYAQLRAQIDRVPVASSLYYRGIDFGPVGLTPTALLRGWTDLLLTDRPAARDDGRAVLEFVQRQALHRGMVPTSTCSKLRATRSRGTVRRHAPPSIVPSCRWRGRTTPSSGPVPH